MLNCPECQKPMIWMNDTDDEDGQGNQYIVTDMYCSDCEIDVTKRQIVE